MSQKNGSEKDKKYKRKFLRLTFSCSAQLFSRNEYWPCDAHNLSLKGVKIDRPKTWDGEIGDSYRLILSLEGLSTISMNVKVRYINEDFIGMEWSKIDIDSFNTLKRIIELNSLKKNQVYDEIKHLKRA